MANDPQTKTTQPIGDATAGKHQDAYAGVDPRHHRSKALWLYHKRRDGKFTILEKTEGNKSDTSPIIIPKVHTEKLAKQICEDHNARI